jgi:glycosyltransferase involved in cell wall biosynthesis
MLITFLAPTARHPVGGIIAIYEFANALARREHEVQLVHLDAGAGPMQSVDEIPWVEFDGRVRQYCPADFSFEHMPDADFLFGFGGDYPGRCGLQLLLVQGYRIIARAVEDALMRGPYPKICVAGWLVEVCRSLGVDEVQAVHVPYGLKHEKYRLVSPIEDRPMQVAMAYNSHPTKGPREGLSALVHVKRRLPEAEVVVFGGSEPEHEIPDGITYLTSPPQAMIVEQIYNRSRVFLNSSRVEGFGLPCIEAMACGCALVTSDNGGARDYAFHTKTALVAPPRKPRRLAAYVERLLTNEDARLRLARAGRGLVERYDWDASAHRIEKFLEAYRADPARFQTAAPGWPGFFEPSGGSDKFGMQRRDAGETPAAGSPRSAGL